MALKYRQRAEGRQPQPSKGKWKQINRRLGKKAIKKLKTAFNDVYKMKELKKKKKKKKTHIHNTPSLFTCSTCDPSFLITDYLSPRQLRVAAARDESKSNKTKKKKE
eukprot:TRINITY_DN4287_c0_g1_i1.p2 TRINITY_DN4287_c0_g1~~TRINITY_DN4287_c0_g1_i1.p2  ORF type:complete len:107 (-),score=14.59 TRINITY_DN4287_c0_g1_i1:109-429(-)